MGIEIKRGLRKKIFTDEQIEEKRKKYSKSGNRI